MDVLSIETRGCFGNRFNDVETGSSAIARPQTTFYDGNSREAYANKTADSKLEKTSSVTRAVTGRE